MDMSENDPGLKHYHVLMIICTLYKNLNRKGYSKIIPKVKAFVVQSPMLNQLHSQLVTVSNHEWSNHTQIKAERIIFCYFVNMVYKSL